MDIKITLSAEDEVALTKIFDGINGKPLKTNLQDFCHISTTVFLDWISGRKRYRSLTEQYIDWVEKLYIQVLPDAKPSYDILYNSFNMSPGQAAYISRVLMEKNLVQWRTMANEELKLLIGAKLKEAQELKKRGETEFGFEITMSNLASSELRRVSDRIREGDNAFELPSYKGRFGSNVIYSIPVLSIITINTHINGK